jgi:HK97 family phage major capsid protein
MPLVGNATPGQVVSPPEFADFFFDRLAAESVFLAAGARVIPTEAQELHVPRVLSDVAANWTAEAAEISVSDPNLDSVVAIPRKLAVLTWASNELFDDSTPDLAELLGTSIARSMALKLDLGFFQGSGTAPEIRGLRNQSGIGAVSAGANGGPITIDMLADAIGQLDAANAGKRRALFMHPRTWTQLSKIKDSTGSNRPVLLAQSTPGEAPRPAIYGVPVFVTSQLATDETQGTSSVTSSAYVADLDSTIVVRRRDVTVVRDSSVKFTSDQVAFRCTARFDLVLAHPEGIVRISGLT